VDSTIDGAYDLWLCFAILFPASLVTMKDVVVSSRQSMQTPLSSDLEGNTMVLEDFPRCTGCAIDPSLICRSWVSEAFAILPPSDSWNRLLAISIKLDDSSSSAF
jgi:hypothetical protein